MITFLILLYLCLVRGNRSCNRQTFRSCIS